MNLSPLPIQKFFDSNGNPLVGGLLFTYVAGTTTKIATYTDSTGGATNTNPIVLNFRGEANVWLDVTKTYKFVLSPPGDTDPPTRAIWAVDNIAAPLSLADITQQLIGQVLYPRTAGEIAAGVVPVNYWWPPGWIYRYATNTVPGTTDMWDAFTKAIAAADSTYPVVYCTGSNAISKPIVITSTSVQNLSIEGTGRVITIIQPLTSDIKVLPININALIINQKDNGHFHLRRIRFFSATTPGYTGVAVYAKEGGGGDGSVQAGFSWVVEDCWVSLQSTASGGFQGGFSNLMARGNVFESTKTGCWILEGAGNSDQQHIGNTMNACFDSYIYANADTNERPMIQVITLNVYQHLRGPAIDGKNFSRSLFKNIVVQPDPGNFGTTGIAQLTDPTDVTVESCVCRSGTGIVRAAAAISFVNNQTRVKLRGIQSDAVTGLQFTGVGALNLTVDDCDFDGCDTAVNWLSGTLSGSQIFYSSRFNNNQHYGMLVTAGTHSWDLTTYNCETMNCGLSGTATDRNFDFNSSGAIRLIRHKFGQNNGSAAATFYVRGVGAGTLEISYPTIIGNPPSGALFYTGAQVPILDGVNSTMPGMPAFTPTLGGTATYTVQVGGYEIVGRCLHYWGQLTVNAIGTGSANTISGFPFASTAIANLNSGGEIFEISASNVNLTANPKLLMATSATSVTVKGFNGAAVADATMNIFAAGTNVRFKGSYPLP